MDRLTTDQIGNLYHQHHDRMLLTARNLLGNADEAYDVVSDVFAELLVKEKTLDERQAENYLLVCVRNKCLNLLEHRRTVKASAAGLPKDTEDVVYEEPPVDEVLDYVSNGLAPKAQQVIEQHFLRQKKYGDIARDMGVSRFTVYKHLSQGIRQLRDHFAWYHLVVALVLLSGAVFAIFIHLSHTAEPQPTVAPVIEQKETPKATPQTIHYEDATLEQILTDVTIYNKVELRFLNDDARQLRLHYDWRQAEPVGDIVSTLDALDGISLELRQNTLYVK